MPIKERLLKERIGYYKSNQGQKYADCIASASSEYQKVMVMSMQLAARFLKVDDQCFENSFKEAQKNQDLFKRLREDEENVRLLVDKPRECELTRDQVKDIIIQQTKMEGKLDRDMAQMQVKTPEQAKMMYAIERTRIMDYIYVNHEVRIVELMKAYKDFELENDEDINALKSANAAEKARLMQQRKESSSLSLG